MQNEYEGFFAEFYDLLQNNCNELPAYVEFMEEFGTQVLELGSGTGRLTIPLAKAGADMTGLELSGDMIALCARKTTPDIADRVRIVQGDMRDFSIDAKFDLVIAPCNVLNHLLSYKEVGAMLRCAKLHLKENGRLILDNSLPNMEDMVAGNGKEESFEFRNEAKGTIIKDRFKASYDFSSGLETDEARLVEFDDDRELRSAEVTTTQAFYFPRELRHLIEGSGLEIEREYGSLRRKTPISRTSREMVFVIRDGKRQ